MKTKKKFTIAYSRTATTDNDIPNESINRQKEAIYKFAEQNGYTIVTYIEHLNRSGNNVDFGWIDDSINNSKEKIGYILVYSKDRISRKFRETLSLEQYLQDQYNISIATVCRFRPCSLFK